MATYFVKKESASAIGSGTYRGIWSATQNYAVGDIVAPTQAYVTAAARGYVYECTADAGSSGGTEPTWVYATPDTSTTTDGGITWTCRNPDTWAKAGVYLDQGLQRATSGSDIIVLKYDDPPTVDKEVSGTTTWTFAANASLIAASEDGATAYTPKKWTPDRGSATALSDVRSQ